LLSLLAILLLLIALMRVPAVQNYLATSTANWLSNKLNTPVEVKGLSFTFLDKLSIDGVYIQDLNKDTLFYTGHLELKITDWFFLKDYKEIKYLGLKDAKVYLNRPKNDSLWNYQFIVDAFSNGAATEDDKASDPFDIALKRLRLENVRFISIDKWVGADNELQIGQLDLDIELFNPKSKTIIINELHSKASGYGLRDYKGGRPPHLKRPKTNEIDTTPFNPDNWKITLKKLRIEDGHYFMDDPDKPSERYGLFNEWKMDIRPVQLDAANIKIVGDTLTGRIHRLTAKDRSGIEIKEMRALVKVSPKIAECKELFLQTNNSVIKDYYAMHYERFPDFTDYIEKVKMVGRFKDAYVAMNDIAFFAPEMALFKDMEVVLNGSGGGTVDHLYANNVDIKDGKSQLFVGKFTMDGLPDMETTDMTFFDSKLRTTGANLLYYFSSLGAASQINWLGFNAMEVNFNVYGSINDLNVQAKINSHHGGFDVAGNLKFVLGNKPQYAADLGLRQVHLGNLLKTELLGLANGNFTFKGSGFDPADLSINTKGEFAQLQTPHYNLHHIGIAGLITPNNFEGKINAKDSNAIVDLALNLQHLNTKPQGLIQADIERLNFQALGLTEDNTILKGFLDGHFVGLSVDAMLGEANLKQMSVTRDGEVLDIDSIYVKSLVEDDIRYLFLGSNTLAARLWGDYKIVELPQTLQHFLAKYLPKYFSAPKHFYSDQLIYFDVKAQNINDLLSVFNRDIAIPRGGTANGILNAATDVISLDAAIPKLIYNGLAMDSVFVNGLGNQQAFDLSAGASRAGYGDNVFLQELDIKAKLKESAFDFAIKTATLDAFSNATLNGKGVLIDEGFALQILPSQIFVNNNNWYIPEQNKIVYQFGKLKIENLEINSDNQHIYINRKPIEEDKAYIELVNIGIAPMSRLLQVNEWVSGGKIEGKVFIEGILDKPKIDFDLSSDSVLVQQEPLQRLNLKGHYDQASAMLTLDPKTGIADKEGIISVSGSWALGSTNSNAMSGLLAFNNAKVSWLNPVLKGYVNKLGGRLSGNVQIQGNLQKLYTDGYLDLLDVGVRPEVLGERYVIPNGRITFDKDKILLGSLLVNDMQQNRATLTGTITHKNLTQFEFDAALESKKLKVLNLSVHEGERYYGNIDAEVSATVKGDATDIKLQASVVPLEHSSLVIPLDFSGDVGTYNYIKFKKPLVYVPSWNKNKLKFSNKYNVRIDAVINNNLSTNIVMDPKTNDELFSRGEGNIVMEIPSDGDIRLNGNYRIESGYYNFAFRQMQVINYNREFKLVPGSSIVWSGDLYDAHLNVSGITSVKARLYDLISNEVNRINLSTQEITDAQLAQIINVRLKVDGTLQNPDMGFKIELTENRSIGTYAYQKLERVNTDETQLLNQVASLLLLDQFAPPEGFMNNTAAVSSGTLNNVTDVLSTVASTQLSTWANRLFKVEDLHVGVRYKNYNLSNNSGNAQGNLDVLNRNQAKLSVRKNFLNNRLLVDVGGVYDWGRPSQVSSNGAYTSNLAGDFMAQYLIRRDGRLRFNIFRTSNYDALFQQNISRQGVGLSYRKSFDNLAELLGMRKAKNPEEATIDSVPVADSIMTN
jgi:hypothetical protein